MHLLMALNKKMKVLLYAGFKDNAVFYSTVSPPLGLFRLKNYLERRGIDCDVLDLSLTEGDFKDSLEKLSLNDSSFSYEQESSAALGQGFRCGFLGLLHMELIREQR